MRAALKSATESADETHRLYRAGRESFISDLDATRTLTSTKSQVAAAEGQVAIDQVNLFLALGGGWEIDAQGAPVATAPGAAGTSEGRTDSGDGDDNHEHHGNHDKSTLNAYELFLTCFLLPFISRLNT